MSAEGLYYPSYEGAYSLLDATAWLLHLDAPTLPTHAGCRAACSSGRQPRLEALCERTLLLEQLLRLPGESQSQIGMQYICTCNYASQ